MFRVVAVVVEVEVDQAEDVTEFVGDHGPLDARPAHERRRRAGNLVGEHRETCRRARVTPSTPSSVNAPSR